MTPAQVAMRDCHFRCVAAFFPLRFAQVLLPLQSRPLRRPCGGMLA
jgi:hypothetical protein